MLLAITGLRREARIAAGDTVKAVSIGGDVRSLQAQIDRLSATPISGVLSFGIAAALSPALKPGDCVVATRVTASGREYFSNEKWLDAIAARMPWAHLDTIAGSSRLLASVSDKATLYAASGAVAADMESHLAAEFALARHLPFVAIRTISDASARALPPAARAALKPDGSLDSWSIAKSILARPGQIPDLIRTERETEKAFAALFRCLDGLGSSFAFPDLG